MLIVMLKSAYYRGNNGLPYRIFDKVLNIEVNRVGSPTNPVIVKWIKQIKLKFVVS